MPPFKGWEVFITGQSAVSIPNDDSGDNDVEIKGAVLVVTQGNKVTTYPAHSWTKVVESS